MKSKSLHRLSLLLPIAAVVVTSLQPARAQRNFSAGSYTENFDALGGSGTPPWADNSTLQGWYASKTNNGTPSSPTTYTAGSGTGTAGALYSFGVAGTHPLTDRALGSVASGGVAAGNFAYGVRFANDTTLSVTNITISYTGEQWRNAGNIATQTLAFYYRISASPITDADAGNASAWTAFTPLNFKTPNVGATASALDGNAAANRQVFSSVLLPGVVVLPGNEIFFRWQDINDTGNDHAVAVDDFSITFSSVNPVTNPPAITTQPQSRTNNAGTTAAFTVVATGTTPAYQWRKDGNDLIDGGNISGATTPTLNVSGVLFSDIADYAVVITNSVGSVTSDVAHLTVIDPAITSQPADRISVAGDTANFFVGAAGTPLLTYQWRFGGVDIPGATTAALNIPNVQSADQGGYSVVVFSGQALGITSSVANLTVLEASNRLVRWDFNATNSLSATAPAPSIGSGSATVINGVTATFATGSFSDPAGAPGLANSGWNTTTYPGQGTSNKLRGVEFAVSTAGYGDILVTWEQRHSDTASKYARLQYSSDGVSFTDGPLITMTAQNNSYVFYSADLSGVASLSNNPNFAFRIVSEFESTAINTANDNYIGTVGNYSTAGTMRFDLVTVFGTPGTAFPIPLSIQQIGTNVVLAWNDPAFHLQTAPVVTGPYTDLNGSTSPHTNAIIGPERYFRLKH